MSMKSEVICFRCASFIRRDGYYINNKDGDVWYTYESGKLSQVAQTGTLVLGGWTIMGENIYWAGGKMAPRSPVSPNLLKLSIREPTGWVTVSDKSKLRVNRPFLVPLDRKLYVLGHSIGGYSEHGDNYLVEVYDLDSQKWQSVLPLDSYSAYAFSALPSAVMDSKSVVFYDVDRGFMSISSLNQDKLSSPKPHPSLKLSYGHPPSLPKCTNVDMLYHTCKLSRPVIIDPTLYWFTPDLYLYGYDFAKKRWFRSPCLDSVMPAIKPLTYGFLGAAPLLVLLPSGKFSVICTTPKDPPGLAIATFTVSKGSHSLSVSVHSCHSFHNLPYRVVPLDGMAMLKSSSISEKRLRTRGGTTAGQSSKQNIVQYRKS